MREWWQERSGATRGVLVAVALVVAINLVLALAGVLTGNDPGGPRSSSYATGSDGLAALARLYEETGHSVSRARDSLAELELDPTSTLVTVDPTDLLPADVDAVRRMLRAGGRVVAAGPGARRLVRAVIGGEIRWEPEGATVARVLLPVSEASVGATVHGDGTGSWAGLGGALPFLGADGLVTGLVADLGAGRLVALADASPLHNANLARGGTAALAVGAAGERGRPVVFDEASHGYGGSRAVLPVRWWWLLGLLTGAAVLLMWSAGKRLGPAEDPDRLLPPARREFVDALAVSLARSGEPARAVAGLQDRARRRLVDRLGLDPSAGRQEMEEAAARAGVPREDVAALFEEPSRPTEVVEVGRAAARHGGGP